MRESTRARVASIVGAATKGQKVAAVFDYSAGGYKNASAEVREGRVSGYDYTTSSHFSGGGSGGNLDFYDYETSSHVQLRVEGNSFSGFDYHSGQHFSGSISGSAVSLFDYQTGSYYNFGT